MNTEQRWALAFIGLGVFAMAIFAYQQWIAPNEKTVDLLGLKLSSDNYRVILNHSQIYSEYRICSLEQGKCVYLKNMNQRQG